MAGGEARKPSEYQDHLMRNEDHRCDKCVFSTKTDGSGIIADVSTITYQCQRFPPQSLGLTHQGALFGWPIMKGEQWCGEFSPRNGDG